MARETDKVGLRSSMETTLSPFVSIREQWVANTFVQISILLLGFNIKRLSPWRNEKGEWIGIEELRASAVKQAREIEGSVVKHLWMNGWTQPGVGK